MTTPLRATLAASIACLAVAATGARAHDDRRAHPLPPPAYQPIPAVPVYVPSPVPPPAWRPPAVLVHGRGHAASELRIAYARLELARERFYATWSGNPWSQRRFERWYAARRAELDSRLAWLSRGHGHGHRERFDG
jgi:acetyl esterase/lipase